MSCYHNPSVWMTKITFNWWFDKLPSLPWDFVPLEVTPGNKVFLACQWWILCLLFWFSYYFPCCYFIPFFVFCHCFSVGQVRLTLNRYLKGHKSLQSILEDDFKFSNNSFLSFWWKVKWLQIKIVNSMPSTLSSCKCDRICARGFKTILCSKICSTFTGVSILSGSFQGGLWFVWTVWDKCSTRELWSHRHHPHHDDHQDLAVGSHQ